jgi:FkbH-like protein
MTEATALPGRSPEHDEQVRAILASATGYAGKLRAAKELRALDLSWRATAVIHVVANYTLDPLAPLLMLACYERGVSVDVTFADPNRHDVDLHDPSALAGAVGADVVLVSVWLDSLPLAFDESGNLRPDRLCDHLTTLVERLRSTTTATIALTTLRRPLHGAADQVTALSYVNLRLRELEAADDRVVVIDIDRAAHRLGDAATIDNRTWFQFRAPFTVPALDELAADIAHVVFSQTGMLKKVVALDCDDTLWGGVIGEDGLSGIALDPYEYPGNIFWTFQRQLLALQARGLLLVLCSRNEERDVLTVLDTHPHCLIRRDRLAGWRLNWNDKVSNLQSLAEELHLDLDAFVFVDDSPLECAMIREMLPMVDVRAVPARLSDLPILLSDDPALPRRARSQADMTRTLAYHAERDRRTAATSFATVEDFLASLDLKVWVSVADRADVPRIAQLTQRTNQFNLSLKRCSAGDIEELLEDPSTIVLTLRVRDRYGDYGITGLTILREKNGTVEIESLLLSCRVLGRRVEGTFLNEALGAAASRWGEGPVTATYVRTERNGQVETFLVHNGFVPLASPGIQTTYVRNTRRSTSSPQFHVAVVRDCRGC